MAVGFCCCTPHFPLSVPSALPSVPSLTPTRVLSKAKIVSASFQSSPASPSEMELHTQGRNKFMEFPFVSSPQRNLMVDLVSTVETRLGSKLLPCTLPLHVQYCKNETGSAEASLHIRSGDQSSSNVDCILGSWLHCALPNGAALNITSLSGYLNTSTDAPNFVFELIESSPTSLVLILDLPPRKDLVLHPEYLQTFYENTLLDAHRQTVDKLSEVQPYISSSLYLRSVLSPTVIMVRMESGEGGPARMEEIVKNHIHPIAKEVFGTWLDQCACGEREVAEEEKACLKKRDQLIKSKTIEIDLGSNFPRLFGPQITNRVIGAIKEVYNV